MDKQINLGPGIRYDQEDDRPWDQHDAPTGVTLSSVNGSRRLLWPYHSEHGDPPYPTWTHLVIDANTPAPPNLLIFEEGAFDPHAVIRVSFLGTDWPGLGDDSVDIKALTLLPVPEPASGLLMLCGAAGPARCVDDAAESGCHADPRSARRQLLRGFAASLKRDQTRPASDGRFAVPAQAPFPQCLLGRRASIIFENV